MRSLVASDRARYFNELSDLELASRPACCKAHQSILRVVWQAGGRHALELVEQYLRMPDAPRIWRDSLRGPDPLPEVADLAAQFESERKQWPPTSGVVGFANRYGFAEMDHDFAESIDGIERFPVRSLELSSIGASMYFTFSTSERPDVLFSLEPSIDILAATISCGSSFSRPTPGFAHPWFEAAGLFLARNLPSTDYELVRGLLRVAMLQHEAGHSLVWRGASPILDFARRVGVSEDSLFRGGFAPRRVRGSWNRLRRREGGLPELSFVFGDFFANATLLAGGVNHSTLVVLRTFAYLMLDPPDIARLGPRGNAPFLWLTDRDAEARVALELERLLEIAHRRPGELASALEALELTSWSELTRLGERAPAR